MPPPTIATGTFIVRFGGGKNFRSRSKCPVAATSLKQGTFIRRSRLGQEAISAALSFRKDLRPPQFKGLMSSRHSPTVGPAASYSICSRALATETCLVEIEKAAECLQDS